MTSPTFRLESLPYQTDATEAVVRVFEGTPRLDGYELGGNRCPLTWAQISSNLQAVARNHRISDARLNLTEPALGQPLDVCVEIETGTGKTLVYLRTLYRLHAAYGWNKFIIVVPFTLQKSAFPRADFVPDPDAKETDQLAALKAFMAAKEASLFHTLDPQAVRDEVLLKCGFQLDVQLTPILEVTANQLYRARDQQTPHHEAIVCFDSHLETTTLEWLRQQKGQRVNVLEAALETTGKWNLHHQLGDGLVVF